MADDKPSSLGDARARLLAHFSGFEGDRYREGWADLWDQGDFLPWDRGGPNPALVDLLDHQGHSQSQSSIIGTATTVDDGGRQQQQRQQRRKKALVPGCGKGYDVLLLASRGYDAYGLEYSASAVKQCELEAKEHADRYPVKDAKLGQGIVQFLCGDFFSDDWLKDAGLEEGKFDLIYDYTFLSALSPDMRPAWAQRMSELLAQSSGANLVCVEFPTYKDPKSGGPPFALPPKVYFEHLSHPGEDIPYVDGEIKFDPLRRASERGLERVAHFQPERTHPVGIDENGKVTDWVSVWRHKS